MSFNVYISILSHFVYLLIYISIFENINQSLKNINQELNSYFYILIM